jgi:hypothetical protein
MVYFRVWNRTLDFASMALVIDKHKYYNQHIFCSGKHIWVNRNYKGHKCLGPKTWFSGWSMAQTIFVKTKKSECRLSAWIHLLQCVLGLCFFFLCSTIKWGPKRPTWESRSDNTWRHKRLTLSRVDNGKWSNWDNLKSRISRKLDWSRSYLKHAEKLNILILQLWIDHTFT